MRWLNIGKSKEDKKTTGTAPQTHPLVARKVWCSVCDDYTAFTRVWRRAAIQKSCEHCGLIFEDPEQVYRRNRVVCPKCEEPLEQSGFDYGCCDCCGSKFELVQGAKPGLLPNEQQRREMLKHGKSWSYE